MTEQLEQLKRDYRDIDAPPYLATRIRASVADRRRPRAHRWMPAAAASVLVAAVVWLSPLVDDPATTAPTKPSLSALATLKPDKPAVSAPSLSKLRTVSMPRMPAKPKREPTKPQTNKTDELGTLKEKDHANV